MPVLLRCCALLVAPLAPNLLAPNLLAQGAPVLTGFVTTPGTPTDFRVDDQPVHCIPDATTAASPKPSLTCPQLNLGQTVAVYGTRDKQTQTVIATRVAIDLPSEHTVQGSAIIDAILLPAHDSSVTVRVEGYAVTLSPATQLTFAGPLHTLADIHPNTILHYTGTLHTDGIVLAQSADLRPNSIPSAEDKLRNKQEFDAAAVIEDRRQGATSRFFLGWDTKRIPAFHDDAMQQRITHIGSSLVPRYQRDLPDADPTKITFRFQLVDQPKLRSTLPLASGIILVPFQLVQMLPDDSQLAAILSSGIASTIQKQALRSQRAHTKMQAAAVAGDAAGLFVPGLGLATGLANMKANSVLEHREEEQSTRTGLAWMQDAGYNTAEAPVAWWTLAAKHPDDLSKTHLPFRTQYLYRFLALTARQPTSTATPARVPAETATP